MPNKVPKGWREMSNIGAVVPGTHFIAFKTPLSWRMEWNLRRLKRAEPRLTHIIDLTNVDNGRYYDSSECQRLGLGYTKVKVIGQAGVPPEWVVQQFYSAVEAALEQHPAGIVGVHSTDGVNRPGYLVCRHLVELGGLQPDEAIAAFDEARGEEQDSEVYLAHLRSRGWEN